MGLLQNNAENSSDEEAANRSAFCHANDKNSPHARCLSLCRCSLVPMPWRAGKATRCKNTAASASASMSAFQYVESRTRDPAFEKLMDNVKYLNKIVKLQTFLMGSSGHACALRPLARLQRKLRLRRTAVLFLRKFPHLFEVFKHPFQGYRCFRLTHKALVLFQAEQRTIKSSDGIVLERLKKLLMISPSGALPYRAILKVYRELGLPDDFEESILQKYPRDFRWVRGDRPGDNDRIVLVARDSALAISAVEKWRISRYPKERADKEAKYSFPLQYPPGFKLSKSYRRRVQKWQIHPYFSPYEDISSFKPRNSGGFKKLEKRAVAILHEFLSLTVEKMVQVEQISHFRKEFNINFNIRDLFLDHPGLFYLSAKGGAHTVFLREAYFRGKLIEPNPVYAVRRKMLDLVVLGRKCIHAGEELIMEDLKEDLTSNESGEECSGEAVGRERTFFGALSSEDGWKTCSDSEIENEENSTQLGSDDSDWSDLNC